MSVRDFTRRTPPGPRRDSGCPDDPRSERKDSFPISTYPMYAFRRASADRFQVVLDEDSAGAIRPLPMHQVADTNDPLIAESLIDQAIRAGSAMR
jgi:hypothetical protein